MTRRSPYNSSIVAALVEAVDRKDSYMAAHMQAVAEIAGLIGLELALPAQELGVLFVGALLHDVGKIAVPDAVLKKSGPLTPQEHALVRLHPTIGANILKHIRILWPVIPAVYPYSKAPPRAFRWEGLPRRTEMRGDTASCPGDSGSRYV